MFVGCVLVFGISAVVSCILALRWCDGVCERFSKSTADAFLFDAMPAVPETERIVISVSFFSLVYYCVCNRCFAICEWCRICSHIFGFDAVGGLAP